MSAIDSLQTTLAAEHAAIYVYGALAAQTSGATDEPLLAALTNAYGEHRGRRDLLVRQLVDLGESPVASAAAYELPQRLGAVAVVRQTALGVERACAATYAALVAQTAGPTRRWATGALSDAAVRELVFRGTPEMLPGADEYADR